MNMHFVLSSLLIVQCKQFSLALEWYNYSLALFPSHVSGNKNISKLQVLIFIQILSPLGLLSYSVTVVHVILNFKTMIR